MPGWLSDEWVKDLCELAASRPPVGGATGTISVGISRGRTDEVAYHWSYRDGTPGDGAAGALADADLVLTIPEADARQVASGEMEPSVAYMRGRLKAAGDGGLLLGWLASTATQEYAAWRQKAAGLADDAG